MSDQMPGRTPDPIQQLENFGTGGVAVNPMDPAGVRRLGDQRRRRQTTLYGAIAAVVVAAAVIPTALIAGKDDAKGGPAIADTPTPTPTPEIVVFPGGGVSIKAAQDTDKLRGTSADFQAFIKTVWQQDRDSGCENAEVDVMKYRSDGFGLGGVGGCGGYQALWVEQGGAWKEALATQDEWVCADLDRYDVPDGFAGDCYTPDAARSVITFPGDGRSVYRESDAAALQGTTDDFKEFVIAEVAAFQADATTHSRADCPDPGVAGITVKRFAQAGYAAGSVFLCPSGYEAIWKKVDGTWKEVLAGQEQWSCPDLGRVGVPRSFVPGGCHEPNIFGPDTVGGVALGMKADEVKAAGGSVEAVTGSSGCRAVTIPSLGSASGADGLYDPTYGVFSITNSGSGDWETPEGIGYGASRADVEQAYPKGHENPETGTWVVPLSGGRHYEFTTTGGAVTAMSLATDNPYCMFQ